MKGEKKAVQPVGKDLGRSTNKRGVEKIFQMSVSPAQGIGTGNWRN